MASTVAICKHDLAVAVNAADTYANLVTLLEIPAPAAQPLIITEMDVTFDGTTATAKPVLVTLCRATATTTGQTSTILPMPENVDANVYTSLITATNVKYGPATAEGTIPNPNVYRLWRLPPTSGMVIQLPLGRGLWVPAGEFFRVRMVANAAVNVTINVSVAEGGQ